MRADPHGNNHDAVLAVTRLKRTALRPRNPRALAKKPYALDLLGIILRVQFLYNLDNAYDGIELVIAGIMGKRRGNLVSALKARRNLRATLTSIGFALWQAR